MRPSGLFETQNGPPTAELEVAAKALTAIRVRLALPAGYQIGADTQLPGDLGAARTWISSLLTGVALEFRAVHSLLHFDMNTLFAHYRAPLKCP